MPAISAYPLAWPPGFRRTAVRGRSAFKTALPAALKNVERSLVLFGKDSRLAVTDIVLSSNVTLGRDDPSDPGVAVWFMWDGEQRCIPVDRYLTTKENLQAIHQVLEARRVEVRHGTLAIVKATMAGLKMLPAPHSPWDILGIPAASPETKIIEAFRAKAKAAHPDQAGGSEVAMADLNKAREDALREIGAKL